MPDGTDAVVDNPVKDAWFLPSRRFKTAEEFINDGIAPRFFNGYTFVIDDYEYAADLGLCYNRATKLLVSALSLSAISFSI